MAKKQLKKLTDYRPLDFGEAFNKYQSKHKRKKQVNGTWVDWDTNTDQAWNDEAASTNVNQLVYGTATPKQDRSYLQAKQNLTNQKDLSKDAFAQIRRQFSPRTVNEGERQIDVTRAAKQREREQNVEALKQQSSFADPVKQQYDSNVSMFRHNIESGYFSDQQIKSFAKSFYEFENTFDSKKYFDTDPEFNYVANLPDLANQTSIWDEKKLQAAELTNPSVEETQKETLKKKGGTNNIVDPQSGDNDESDGQSILEQTKVLDEPLKTAADDRRARRDRRLEDKKAEGRPLERLRLEKARNEGLGKLINDEFEKNRV